MGHTPIAEVTIHSSETHSETETVVHISVEMVLPIKIMGAGVIRTGGTTIGIPIIEALMVENHTFSHKELCQGCSVVKHPLLARSPLSRPIM